MEPTQHTVAQFVALERQVWDALVSGDPNADMAQLTDDFLGVYETGFANRQDHGDQLLNGPLAERYEISEARIQVYADDLVLLAYRALWIRPGGKEQVMYISSIWKNTDGVWRNTFSQDTPAKP